MRELVAAPILDEANKLARDVLAPLNPIGHKTGAKLTGCGRDRRAGVRGRLRAVPRSADGWGLAFLEEFGGQGLPCRWRWPSWK